MERPIKRPPRRPVASPAEHPPPPAATARAAPLASGVMIAVLVLGLLWLCWPATPETTSILGAGAPEVAEVVEDVAPRWRMVGEWKGITKDRDRQMAITINRAPWMLMYYAWEGQRARWPHFDISIRTLDGRHVETIRATVGALDDDVPSQQFVVTAPPGQYLLRVSAYQVTWGVTVWEPDR